MFQGEFEYSLDEKNRVVLPASLRKGIPEAKLKDGFTLVIGPKAQCLELHPMQEWTDRIDRQQAMYSDDNEEAQEYFRDVLSSAYEVILDKNYRFVIPEARKKEAGMGKEVVFIGVWKRIEIWDRRRWQERHEKRAGKQRIPKPDKEA